MTIKNIKDRENELNEKYGGVVGNGDLRHLLGYKSYSTFNRAVRKGLVVVEVFEIKNRRGKFALTTDIANWLNELKVSNKIKEKSK